MRNCLKLAKWSLFFRYYVFVDVKEYLADNLFIYEKVRVWFQKEYWKEDTCYKIIFCKVRKKDELKFLEALKKLENKMLLFGYSDYIDFCNCLLSKS